MSNLQICSVNCESYSNSIVPRIYENLVRGSMGDCILSAEGKFLKAHKLMLTVSSEYFEVSKTGVKFEADLKYQR